MRIFIGSSGKHLNWSEEIALYLAELKQEPIPWFKTGSFVASGYTLENIYNIAKDVDAGLFVLAPDDELTSSEFITRDNVIFEAGMYFGLKGKNNVALCMVDPSKTKLPSDLKGLTYIDLRSSEYEVKKSLNEWISKTDILPTKQPNNILMSSRDDIESIYSIEDRFKHIDHIKDIRILNLASTTIVSPAIADYYHHGSTLLAKKIQDALCKGVYVELIITEPGTYAMDDALRKVANRTSVKDQRAVFYGAYANLFELLHNTDSEFYKAYNRQPRQFNYFLTNISLPFSIFCIEYEAGYKEYDNIKIDIYSAELKAERDRRSMVIYKKYDPNNYRFFRENYEDIRSRSVTNMNEIQLSKKWLSEWTKIKQNLFGN